MANIDLMVLVLLSAEPWLLRSIGSILSTETEVSLYAALETETAAA